jgi:predicted phosphodiesterase
VLFVPDCHHPYVHRPSWLLMLKAMFDWQPDIIVVLGDFGDLASMGDHPPDEVVDEPGFLAEVYAVSRALEELEFLGASRLVYIEGNHETRLSRHIARNSPELWDCISWPELLKLDDRGWEWVPYRTTFKLGKLRITHDTGEAGMNAHRSAAQAHMGSTIIGHTHRMAYEVRGTFDSHPYLAAMFGWLGDHEVAARYTHDAKARSTWVHGFGTGLLLEDGICHVQPVPIVSGKCVVSGKLYEL